MPAGSTYTPIATTTLGSASNTVTFSSIASSYTDLVLICSSFTTSAADNMLVRFNSDTASNYSTTNIIGNGTSATSGRTTSQSAMVVGDIGDPSVPTSVIINVQNYANTTTYKTALARSAYSGQTIARVGLWRKTPEAINSITLIADNSRNFGIGSTFTLYGIASA